MAKLKSKLLTGTAVATHVASAPVVDRAAPDFNSAAAARPLARDRARIKKARRRGERTERRGVRSRKANQGGGDDEDDENWHCVGVRPKGPRITRRHQPAHVVALATQ